MTEQEYMKRAIRLAEKGVGRVNPNPLVGAVIVKNGRIIGEGYHEAYGEWHAERNALAACIEDPKGATMYVTLEPCCHQGKTPPCTEAVIAQGIARVVIGHLDPNPVVAGKGVSALREAGIEVTCGVLEEDCGRQNEVFFSYIQKKQPYVVMKYAMSIDGKIATCTGESKWLTGETARRRVMEDRKRYMAIMVGIRTVVLDDPVLTCRIKGGRNPIRIICDTHLRLSLNSMIARTADQVPTIVATCNTDKTLHSPYEKKGIEVLVVREKSGHIDLKALMLMLGERGIDSIYLEGGGTLNFSAVREGIVNKVQAFIAPKLLGGAMSKTPVEGEGIQELKRCIRLGKIRTTQLGADILLEGEVEKCLQES